MVSIPCILPNNIKPRLQLKLHESATMCDSTLASCTKCSSLENKNGKFSEVPSFFAFSFSVLAWMHSTRNKNSDSEEKVKKPLKLVASNVSNTH